MDLRPRTKKLGGREKVKQQELVLASGTQTSFRKSFQNFVLDITDEALIYMG